MTDTPQKLPYQLKPISSASIPEAIDRARQYRALGQAAEAESICLDILACDDNIDEAIVLLLLALTDQFEHGPADLLQRAMEQQSKLNDEYHRYYYEGIICERQCKALLHRAGLRARHAAYDFLRRAMHCYALAEKLRAKGNDETILRWNGCVRLLQRYPQLEPAESMHDSKHEPGLE